MLAKCKLIVTTSWDDGAATDIKLADLLVKYGIKGTFYVPKSYLNSHLEEADIKEIDRFHEIGAHTLNHRDLTKIPINEARAEIVKNKEYLEDVVGHRISTFCYPYGRYNQTIKRIVKQAGFIAARTCEHGELYEIEDPYEWKITLHASNGSPVTTIKIWLESRISIKSLFDWYTRAKLLFNHALKNGGIYHIWGHSHEFINLKDWYKLEKLFKYISSRKDVCYLTNRDIFSY